MSKEAYEPDEFDVIAEDFPSGAHRRPVKGWHSWLPVLVILILGPTLAWGVFMLVDKSADSNKTTAQQANITSSDKESKTASDKTENKDSADQNKDSKDSADQNTQQKEATPAVEVKKDLSINVLNTTKRKGAAAELQKKLKDAGFSKVDTGNGKVAGLNGNTVFYKNAQDKGTALEAAKLLGIPESQVKEAPTDITLSAPITVLIA